MSESLLGLLKLSPSLPHSQGAQASREKILAGLVRKCSTRYQRITDNLHLANILIAFVKKHKICLHEKGLRGIIQ
jgi:hypothetical protein